MRSGTDTLHLVDLLPTEVELLRIGMILSIIVNETEETITAEAQFSRLQNGIPMDSSKSVLPTARCGTRRQSITG